MRRYPFAPDDAPLYQLPVILGRGVHPAISETVTSELGSPLRVVVELDIPGAGPVRMAADSLRRLDNPLPPAAGRDWVFGLVARALQAEDECAHADSSPECLERALNRVPAEILDYAKAWHQAGEAARSYSWTFPHNHPRSIEINTKEA